MTKDDEMIATDVWALFWAIGVFLAGCLVGGLAVAALAWWV